MNKNGNIFISIIFGFFAIVFFGPIGLIIVFGLVFAALSNGIKKLNIDSDVAHVAPEKIFHSSKRKLVCSYCRAPITPDYGVCPKCGAKIEVTDFFKSNSDIVSINDFDPKYKMSDEWALIETIKNEFNKLGEVKDNLVPPSVLRRKNVVSAIICIYVFAFVSSIFVHFPLATYIILLVILFLIIKLTRGYDIYDYMKREVMARPDEKISNVISSIRSSLVEDKLNKKRFLLVIVAILVPLFIFRNPVILYEKCDGGYAVRFYMFGLTEFKTAKIPSEYKNEKVVSLRGNTFSNMPFLEEVILPDTITEIRGQAFLNDRKLVNVVLPKYLEYLGGGAFKNCSSLKEIYLPDTLTYLGGEVFLNATSLEKVRLSNSLTEIRGNSFENCTSLRSISIPDNVSRIGGHAFRGDIRLSEVSISENSRLSSIGSSAFRECNSLYSISIPRRCVISERAFKDTPTTITYY